MTVGLGAVATTYIAGIENVRRGTATPVGSLAEMATIRLGKRTEGRSPKIRDFVPLADLSDIVFAAWDPIPDDGHESCKVAGVLDDLHIEPIADFLKGVKPMPAVFSQDYVKRLSGTNVKKGKNKRDLAEQLRVDIRNFKEENGCDRVVVVWCASTEVFVTPHEIHGTIESFEKAMEEDHPAIAPSMLYAWASIMEGVPFANGAPNLCVDIPALQALAEQNRVPISGKDFKTGQTMVKTVMSPMLKARMLGLSGWFSTNILGNRDGEVLDDPESFKTKEESKLGVLEHILQPDMYPELYKDLYHKVRINYYPPRRIKIDFLCRDSILAAPLVHDLTMFMDLAQRTGMSGIQEWLSFYYKSPMAAAGLIPENDLFIQQTKFKNTLRWIMGEDQITHLGVEYYEYDKT
jgi:myo-inositol-1-phosphate synthase